MTSKTSTPAQPGNELYFTAGTKRAARIGNTLVVVTEGARITITLPVRDGEATRVGVVVTEPGVVVSKSVRKSATGKQNAAPAPAEPQATEPQAAAKPAPAKRAARKPAAAK